MALDDDTSPTRYGYDYQQQLMDREQERIRRLLQDAEKQVSDIEKRPELARSREENPFIAFRRFVDAQFDTLAEGLRSIPSGLTDLRARLQESREKRIQDELDTWRRWTGHEAPNYGDDVAAPTAQDREDAIRSALTLLRHAIDRNANVPRSKVDELYKQDFAQAVFGRPTGVFGLIGPAGSTGGGGNFAFEYMADSYRWLSVDWFKNSPYSPIQVEAQDDRFKPGMWRAAFEDLINASLDKPMLVREQYGMRNANGPWQSTWQCPGVDWMLSLQCRGILPPQLPRLYSFLPGQQQAQDKVMEKILSAEERPMESSADVAAAQDFYQLVDEIMTPCPPQDTQTDQDMYEHQWREDELSCMSGNPDEDFEAATRAAYFWNERGCSGAAEKVLAAYEKMHGPITEPVWTGDQQQDFIQAVRAADHADRRRDTVTAGMYMDEYYRIHEGLDDEEEDEEEIESRWEKLYNEMWPNKQQSEKQRPAPELKEEQQTQAQAEVAASNAFADRLESLQQQAEALGLDDDKSKPSPWKELQQNIASKMASLDESRKTFMQSAEPQATVNDDKKPAVLSSLTTTHRTVLPDGTVTTKVVLKQRFADGREETHESLHTSSEQAQLVEPVGDDKQEQKERKKGGWFWS